MTGIAPFDSYTCSNEFCMILETSGGVTPHPPLLAPPFVLPSAVVAVAFDEALGLERKAKAVYLVLARLVVNGFGV